MEVRGIGLIDVRAIFGINAVRQQKRIEVVVTSGNGTGPAVVERTPGSMRSAVHPLGSAVPKITGFTQSGKEHHRRGRGDCHEPLLPIRVDKPNKFNERLIDHMQRARSQRALVQRYLTRRR